MDTKLIAVALFIQLLGYKSVEAIELTMAETTHDEAAAVDLNAIDAFGRTCLHNRVLNRDSTSVLQLLIDGANTDIQDNAGRTALHYAAQSGQSHIVSWLLALGADKNLTDIEGKTALDLARENFQTAVVKRLSNGFSLSEWLFRFSAFKRKRSN